MTPEGAASQRDPHRACGCGRALGTSRALGAPRRSGASTGTLRLAQAAGAAGRPVPLGRQPHVTRVPGSASERRAAPGPALKAGPLTESQGDHLQAPPVALSWGGHRLCGSTVARVDRRHPSVRGPLRVTIRVA